jgi:hypothetical protein
MVMSALNAGCPLHPRKIPRTLRADPEGHSVAVRIWSKLFRKCGFESQTSGYADKFVILSISTQKVSSQKGFGVVRD